MATVLRLGNLPRDRLKNWQQLPYLGVRVISNGDRQIITIGQKWIETGRIVTASRSAVLITENNKCLH